MALTSLQSVNQPIAAFCFGRYCPLAGKGTLVEDEIEHLKKIPRVLIPVRFGGFFIYLVMDQVLNKGSIIQTLNAHREELVGFGVERIGLFGSYNKDKMRAESDIDFLVEIQKDKKTFRNFMALAYFLEDLFNKKIDLVTPQSLSPHIGPHILKSVEYVSFAD